MRPLWKSIAAAALSLLSGCLSLRYLELPNHGIEEKGNKVKVMAYNIGNARGNTADFFARRSKEAIEKNLDCIVEQSKDMDILALNEADSGSYRTSWIDQPRYIAEHAGFNYVIVDDFFTLPGLFELGNAILSKHPLEFEHVIPYGGCIEKLPHMFKNAMYAYADVNGKKLLIGVTHLNNFKSEKNRTEEFALNLAYLKSKSRFILLGDFNAQPHFDSLEKFLGSGLFNVSPNFGIPTYPADKPTLSIDHIVVSKDIQIGPIGSITAESVGCKETPSDHENVFAEVYW